MKKTTLRIGRKKGFTLVELLVVIAIIGILMVVAYIVINPSEYASSNRDATRLSDLASLDHAVITAVQEATSSGVSNSVLCNGKAAPCSGNSNDTGYNVRSVDGTGWIKVNLSQNSQVPTLPVDPVNNSSYRYTYSVNNSGTGYEIGTVLESQQYKSKMINGSHNDLYAVGSDLTILP